MKNNKLFLFTTIVLVVIVGFSMMGFTANKYKMGFAILHVDPFCKNMSDGALEKAKELNVDLTIYNADNRIENQIQQVENLITKKVDAILLQAVDHNGCAFLVDNCKEAGVPIIVVNCDTTSPNMDTYVGSYDVEAGKIQAEWILENIGGDTGGNIAILFVPMGCTPQLQRYQGFKETLLDKYPNWKVLAELPADSRRDKAMQITEDWLQTYGDKIDVIVAQNDEMAMGAVQAIKNHGITSIKVLGVDATEDAVQAVKDGEMAMTVFQDARGQGAKAVEVAVGILEGKTYPKQIYIPFIPVTPENVDEFLPKKGEIQVTK